MESEVEMAFKFIPNRLINAKNEISKVHSRVNSSKFVYTDKERKVIKKVLGWTKDQLKIKHLTLTADELIIIASYLPYNFDNVNMENLFEVMNLSFNSQIGKALFTQWNYSYKNDDCNRYMASLLENASELRNPFKDHAYDVDKMVKVLKSTDTLCEYGKMLLKFSSGKDLQEKLDFHDVGSNTMLRGDCVRYYYVFCRAEDYLDDKNRIRDIIASYDEKHRRMFLLNFVNVLSLEELLKFSELADFCTSSLTGNIDSNKYIRFFENIPESIEKKYRNWINSCRIVKFFGTDERSVFWKKYRFVSVQKNVKHGMISLECDDYYITEFLGKGMGAMYIYDKKTYKESVTRWMAIYNTSELKSHMYHNEGMALRRFVHLPQPGWQYDFKNFILSRKITDTLY